MDQVTGTGARDVIDDLDKAIADVDPDVSRRRWWWGLFSFLQWFALLATAVGMVLFGLSFAPDILPGRESLLPAPQGIRLDVWLIADGLMLALGLTVSARFFGALSAHRTAVKFEKRLREAVKKTTDTVVLERLQGELDRYGRYRDGVRTAAY